MDIGLAIILSLFTFLLGMIVYKVFNEALIKRDIKNKKKEIESIFISVLKSINSGQSNFKSRFLQTAYVTTSTSKTGIIDVIYLIDKSDIAILKNGQVKYTSEGVGKNIIDEIINSINYLHGKEINDVVNVFGLLFSKKDFESSFKMKFEDFNKIINRMTKDDTSSDIDNIINSNQDSFDIDEILDKIGKHGLGSLTDEEKQYLNDYSNGRKD